MNQNKHQVELTSLDLKEKNDNNESISDLVEITVAKKLIIIIIICTLFMISEIIGGIFANSLAIICDAFHLLSDLGGFIISLFSTYLATRKATKRMNFGYRRVEILGAFSSIIIIWLLTGALLYIAITRIINGDFEIDSKVMTTMASIGVVFNIIIGFVLSYSHKPKKVVDKRRNSMFNPPKIIDSKISFNSEKSFDLNLNLNNQNLEVSHIEKINSLVSRNINIRAAFIHIIGDLIQSLGVLIASLVIFFKPSWKIADPICTILFSIIVLSTTLPIMIDIINVLNESFPKQIDYDDLVKKLISIYGVKEVVDLKVWYLSTDLFALNAKILIDSNLINRGQLDVRQFKNLIEKCESLLKFDFNFHHINIHIDLNELVTVNHRESLSIGKF